ncbi:hypothetical protein BD779DRAFT_1503226 [Infundibulicybe gibba]|nr:hypothetical protein BD779DRAFT_1503226 [Infundibulicybe gibba]
MIWYALALWDPRWLFCVASPLINGNSPNHNTAQLNERVIEIGPPPFTMSFLVDGSTTSLVLPLETSQSLGALRPGPVASLGLDIPSHTPTTRWASPPTMTDLSAFNVSTFAGGEQNLAIVTGIPANSSATLLAAEAVSTDVPSQFWDNSTSALRLLYPADSINPAGRPVGGAEFYASPLELENATSVTLQYDVFFPIDFDWVLAGKLPGLYGGHTGCSGGNKALDCFSTRLMWRKDGCGELYLYAPKDKQTNGLCSDPQSVCDAAYGLSIGRCSFTYSAGLWTTVNQTVVLNTPGKQDGIFVLIVNGKRVIYRSDVFYRDVPPPVTQAKPPLGPSHTGAGLLGGILLQENNTTPPLWETDTIQEPNKTTVNTPYEIQRPTSSETPAASDRSPDIPQVTTEHPVGFTGLFFSTFFGGHEERYATPRDQYVWFKDFGMSCN